MKELLAEVFIALIVMLFSFALGAFLTWNFACYKLDLDIERGHLVKDGVRYYINSEEHCHD